MSHYAVLVPDEKQSCTSVRLSNILEAVRVFVVWFGLVLCYLMTLGLRTFSAIYDHTFSKTCKFPDQILGHT